MTATQPVAKGDTVNVHYVGTLEDGSEFDSSKSRNQVLTFTVGGTQVITGFSNAVIGMEVGETRNITLSPEEAYGMPNKEAVSNVSRTVFPEGFEFVKGSTVSGTNGHGQPLLAKILDYTETEVTLDMNHPLAGMILNFEIELESVD